MCVWGGGVGVGIAEEVAPVPRRGMEGWADVVRVPPYAYPYVCVSSCAEDRRNAGRLTSVAASAPHGQRQWGLTSSPFYSQTAQFRTRTSSNFSSCTQLGWPCPSQQWLASRRHLQEEGPSRTAVPHSKQRIISSLPALIVRIARIVPLCTAAAAAAPPRRSPLPPAFRT